METILCFSIVWIVFGIIGLLGFSFVVPKRFKGQKWEKTYIRKKGVCELMLGVPWLLIYIIFHDNRLEFMHEQLVVLICALPSIVCSITIDKKYKALLENNIE